MNTRNLTQLQCSKISGWWTKKTYQLICKLQQKYSCVTFKENVMFKEKTVGLQKINESIPVHNAKVKKTHILTLCHC